MRRNQNGLNSQLAIGLGGYSTKQAMNSKYLSGTLMLYRDSLFVFVNSLIIHEGANQSQRSIQIRFTQL